MNRRKVIGLVAGSMLGVAGCVGGSGEEEIHDSDDDGMIDSKDYAPKDASVQLKSDVSRATATPRPTSAPVSELTASATRTPTRTRTPSPTPTPTATATPTPSVPSNSLTANISADGALSSGFDAYSLRSVTLRHFGDLTSGDYPGDVNALVCIATYPNPYTGAEGDVVWVNRSQAAFDPYGDATIDVSIDIPSQDVPSEPFYMWAAIVRSDRTFEELEAGDGEQLGETDRLRVRNGRLKRDPPSSKPADIKTRTYEREETEGGYNLSYYGETRGRSWSVSLVLYKSAYFAASNTPRRTYDYASYVSQAISSGYATELGTYLMEDAEAAGFTSKRTQAEFVIRFVQALPYASDDVTTGFDEYPKTVVETIVEGGGDCEDTAILTAALLQAEPFGYDTILISPPSHMAVGVYGTDLPGTYWELDGRRYYYLETTSEGYDVGDLPQAYEGESARLYQV